MPNLPPVPEKPVYETVKTWPKRTAPEKEGRVRVVDKRPDATEKANYTGRYPEGTIRKIIQAAKSYGVDPALALAIGLQESALGKLSQFNPLQLAGSSGAVPSNVFAVHPEDMVEAGMRHLKMKMQSMRGASPELQIQAYNGLGKPMMEKGYGGLEMDVPMRERPLYGQRVMALKEHAIQQSPEILSMIQSTAPEMHVDPQATMAFEPQITQFLKQQAALKRAISERVPPEVGGGSSY